MTVKMQVGRLRLGRVSGIHGRCGGCGHVTATVAPCLMFFFVDFFFGVGGAGDRSEESTVALSMAMAMALACRLGRASK